MSHSKFLASLACLLLFSSTLTCADAATKNHQEKYITFQKFIYPHDVKPMQRPSEKSPQLIMKMTAYARKPREVDEKVNIEKIIELIKDVRPLVCKFIGDGYVKVWLNAGVKAGAIVVSTSANTGMEVVINCKSHDSKIT